MEQEYSVVSQKRLVQLGNYLQKIYRIDEQEALEMIYEEWDLVEAAFASEMKVEEVLKKLLYEFNEIYRVA
jgi:hypothetical protein